MAESPYKAANRIAKAGCLAACTWEDFQVRGGKVEEAKESWETKGERTGTGQWGEEKPAGISPLTVPLFSYWWEGECAPHKQEGSAPAVGLGTLDWRAPSKMETRHPVSKTEEGRVRLTCVCTGQRHLFPFSHSGMVNLAGTEGRKGGSNQHLTKALSGGLAQQLQGGCCPGRNECRHTNGRGLFTDSSWGDGV